MHHLVTIKKETPWFTRSQKGSQKGGSINDTITESFTTALINTNRIIQRRHFLLQMRVRSRNSTPAIAKSYCHRTTVIVYDFTSKPVRDWGKRIF